jgi:hypothetical protein
VLHASSLGCIALSIQACASFKVASFFIYRSCHRMEPICAPPLQSRCILGPNTRECSPFDCVINRSIHGVVAIGQLGCPLPLHLHQESWIFVLPKPMGNPALIRPFCGLAAPRLMPMPPATDLVSLRAVPAASASSVSVYHPLKQLFPILLCRTCGMQSL